MQVYLFAIHWLIGYLWIINLGWCNCIQDSSLVKSDHFLKETSKNSNNNRANFIVAIHYDRV